MKNVTGVYTAPRQHWVGNGFPVRSMFSYQTHGESLSPFLLLDYAGPHTFPADAQNAGWASIRIVVLKRSPLSIPAKWSIATPPAEAASLVRATCSG